MTPKEKAIELCDKFDDITNSTLRAAKRCALISVDEIMFQIRWKLSYGYEKDLFYWQEVKQEIEKL